MSFILIRLVKQKNDGICIKSIFPFNVVTEIVRLSEYESRTSEPPSQKNGYLFEFVFSIRKRDIKVTSEEANYSYGTISKILYRVSNW